MPPKVMRPYVPKRHPLQRIRSPSHGFSSLVHFAGLSSFASSFKFLVDYPNIINDSYGWHFQYLTIIGLSIATLAFLAASLADLTSSQTLFRIKNLFSTIATPLEVIVTVLYGGLCAIDKRLVVPKELELPFLADLSFHVVPALVLVIDFLLLSPPFTISNRQALAFSTALAFAYWFWIEQCYRHNGFYPYPLFAALNVPWRILLFSFSGCLMTGSTVALKWFYSAINGQS